MYPFLHPSFRFQPTNTRNVRLSFAEQLICWTIVLTPLWWLLCIQPLLYPAIVIFLLIQSFNFDKVLRKPLPLCIWFWLAMSIVMLWTAMSSISNATLGVKVGAAAVATFAKGYFLIFTCLVLPFWNSIRVEVVTRAISWLASCYSVTILIQLGMLLVGKAEPFIPPWSRYFPGNPLSFVVKAATYQQFFGVTVPRTSLYTPDPPILGICGVLCFIICLGESNRILRRWGLIGSFIGLVASLSRLGWICLPVALIITAVFRSSSVRQGSLWGGTLTALLCISFGGITIGELLNKPLEIFTKARPASSTDREFVVQKTLEAWQQSPWLGWGVAQGTANWHTYSITLGSFSTYAAVLYLHGIVGFAVFLLALFTTAWSVFNFAIQGSKISQRAFGVLISLYIFMEAIPLTWMATYFWFFFVWLGAILAHQTKLSSLQLE